MLLKEFISGLADTDGSSRKDGKITIVSTSCELLQQVHLCLLGFGIVSSLKSYLQKNKNWNTRHEIKIYGNNSKLFFEKISFRLPRKQYFGDYHQNKQLNGEKLDIIPNGMLIIKKIRKKIVLNNILYNEWSNNKPKYHLTYNKLKWVINFFQRLNVPMEDLQQLIDLQKENFFFDQVESIEDMGERDCLDFNIPDGEMYWSNGFISHNTWTAAVYCILQAILEPKTSILVAGPTFRTARFIFNHIEKICNQPEAQLLAQAMGAKIRRNDEFRWNINGGEIVAIPLNGEKIRGFRANILVIDEFLLMAEEMVERVLIPYLVVPKDLTRRKRIREREDELIERGVITEKDRTKFENKAKLIALSSASYTCEYLYKKYDEYVKAIYSDTMPDEGAKYFVSQLGWDSIPVDRIDKSVIELAQSNEGNMATFQREYCAQFLDGSDSYFSMKKMMACTVPDGESPTLLLQGSKDKKYLLTIDPSFSNSPTSDDFSMKVTELDDEGKVGGTIVHLYDESGKDLKDHIRYFHYLLTHFNIEMIMIDNAGYQFIDAANESQLFVNDKINLKFFDFVSEKTGDEYLEQIKAARMSYNKQMGRIVFAQYFTTDFIRNANEWLQGCFDYKRLWFASGLKADPQAFEKAVSLNVDVKSLIGTTLDKDESAIGYFIDNQSVLTQQTKYQCASIEVKTTIRGIQSFDLPQIMKRDNTPNRMRRDSYTTCMMSAWLMKCYNDIMTAPVQSFETFEPIFV